jgi:hypothetical protein
MAFLLFDSHLPDPETISAEQPLSMSAKMLYQLL